MPVRAAGLTAARVKTAPPGRYGDGDGLYLFVRAPESAYWCSGSRALARCGRWASAGRGGATRWLSSRLATRRRLLSKQVRAGLDPLAEREAAAAVQQTDAAETARKAVIFQEVAEDYLTANGAGWRNPKHRAQWGSSLATYAHPSLGHLPSGT